MNCDCRRWRSSPAPTRWRKRSCKPWRFPMPLHDAHYQHWDGLHTGIWGRRCVIARNGLAACLRGKLLRYVIMASWMGGLMMAAILFILGQFLVPDSIMTRWVAQMNPDL